jgi:transposase
MRFFAGIDWASEQHAVCVVDAAGRVRWQARVAHSDIGLQDLVKQLQSWQRRGTLAVAIERPSGVLVDTLVDAGLQVVPIHPNVLKASRPRYTSSGAKDDPGDAFMLADLLRTDHHRFRPLQSPTDATRALRALVRGRDELVRQRVALANQVRAHLERCWPGAAVIFAEIDSPIALAFLARYPTPPSAARLSETSLAAFLAKQKYSGRRSAPELLARLRAAAVSRMDAREAQTSATVVRAVVAVLTPLVAQIRRLDVAIAAALAEHPDGALVQSFPRAGTITAAKIVAELGDDRTRFASADHVAAEAGVAPVTHASGHHRGVVFRWTCNKRLRQALTTFADNSRHASAWAAGVYARARTRGCRHPHAVRILARAWVRVLWRCWQVHEPYDVRRHRAALTAA